MSNRAWVTLATNDSYGLGALVLAHSLRRAGSAYPAVVLITPTVTDAMKDRLRAVFAEVIVVDVLDSGDAAHLALLQRPELGITFTKIHCWSLTQYEKCVFLDADTLIVQNCDELFEREELSAAPDVGWPDCFNSGVFVYTPSADTFARLIAFAQERGSFDGGDQGLLNAFFSDWAHGDINKHLPFLYNVTSVAFYSYLPALKQYGQNLKIVHFIGSVKPWLQQYNWQSRTVDAPDHLRQFLQLWWDILVDNVHPQLDTTMEPTTVEVEEMPPVLPPQDVQQHYAPKLDSGSEFHWHHPEVQISDAQIEAEQIDLSQIHDPWEHYRGNMPLPHESWNSEFKSDENVYEIGKRAWEYQSESEFNQPPPHYTQPYVHESNEPETWHQHFVEHLQHEHRDHDQYQHKNYQEHNESRYDHKEHHYSQEPIHNENSHHQQHTENHDHHHEKQQNYNDYHRHHSHHHPQKIDNGYPQQHNTQQDDSNDHWQHGPNSHVHHTKYQEPQNYVEPQTNQQRQNDFHLHLSKHHNSLVEVDDVLENAPKSKEDTIHISCQHHIPQIPKKQYVYHVYLDVMKDNRRKSKINRIELAETKEIMNGHVSESDSDDDEIIPRHPYDGFYLRHRSTIDPRGRKICTHEIPPTPSPSPPPDEPDSPPLQECPSPILSDDFDTASECEDQTGVAGNLARVVMGEAGYQGKALDELSRRQGWEAGNIDYMGADSFANIWAKISQTLNQPSPKQPSPPRKEPTPPKEPVPEAPATSEVLAPVAPEATATVEAPAPAPESAAVTTEAPLSVSAPAAAVVSAPIEIPLVAPEAVSVVAPLSTPASTQIEASAPASVEASAPTAADSPAPVTAEYPGDLPVPITKAVAVAEVPKTVEEVLVSGSAPTVTASATEAAPKATKDKTEPDVPPTPPVTPKSTPEASTPVTEAPPTVEATTTKSKESGQVEAPKIAEPTPATPVSPAPAFEAPSSPAAAEPAKPNVTPQKALETSTASTDSPPLANTPSKEEVPAVPAAKSEERRKPAGKLQLSPPAAADPIPTPDSELEDAAALAQSIIASELSTTLTAASPPAETGTPTLPQQESRLSVESPEVPTPPVSLAQIGVKPKGKSTTAAQIESSVTDKVETPASEPSTPGTPTDVPKKKLVKKAPKKEAAASSDVPTPVPPPRKKEKKPKEK